MGAVVSPGSQDTVEVIDLSLSSALGLMGPKIEGIVSHPKEQLTTSGSSIAIGSTSQQRVVVFLTLSSPRTINISSAAASGSFAVASTGQAWDGVSPVSGIQGRTDLLLRAAMPGMFSASLSSPSSSISSSSSMPQIVLRGREYDVADDAFLRSQLSNYVEFGKTSPGRGRIFPIKAFIREDGTVTRVTCPVAVNLSSDCSIAVSAILQWRFKPFLSNGSAVPVVAQFPILVSIGGELSSPLSPSAILLK